METAKHSEGTVYKLLQVPLGETCWPKFPSFGCRTINDGDDYDYDDDDDEKIIIIIIIIIIPFRPTMFSLPGGI